MTIEPSKNHGEGQLPLRRGLLALLGIYSASIVLGCPVDTTEPGDVLFGEYLVTAAFENDECGLNGTDGANDFSFRARLAADLDGETAWLSLAYPPEAPLQQARWGMMDGHDLVFVATERTPSEDCGCYVEATETLIFRFIAPATDKPEKNGEENGEENDIPPIAGLPHPDHVTGVEGALLYDLVDLGDCPPPDEGCDLPCSFDYELFGPRQR